MQSSAHAALEHFANLFRENWRLLRYVTFWGLGTAVAACGGRCQEAAGFAAQSVEHESRNLAAVIDA